MIKISYSNNYNFKDWKIKDLKNRAFKLQKNESFFASSLEGFEILKELLKGGWLFNLKENKFLKNKKLIK